MVCLLTVCIEGASMAGVIHTRIKAIGLLTGLIMAGFIGWLKVAFRTIIAPSGRARIAAAIERTDPRFQDRLNTMLFLENETAVAEGLSFRMRIADQARRVLTQKGLRLPISAGSPVGWSLAFFLLVIGIASLNGQYGPWQRLSDRTLRVVANSPTSRPPTELALPANNVEHTQSWGEIRIIEPGKDLRVTKVDVVPLSIEAAANDDLRQVEWYSSVNGGEETQHDLSAPKDPRCALYRPTIYLDELALADWDVLTYYAKAETTSHQSYASDVYFIEVRPFREDIAKIPGGAGGQPYQTLNDISSLVGLQQRAIRDTHQLVQKPPVQEPVRAQTRMGLAGTEAELASASQHLYADMAATMENKPIGAALDSLAQAQSSLNQASSFLKENVMEQAQSQERSALAELVAVRKIFQKAVSEHPGDFTQPSQRDSPVAESSKKLNEMAEFRDEAKSAEEFVQRSLEQQQEVERQAAGPMQEGAALAGQEQRLARELKDFAGEHPKAFQGSESESAQAQESLQHAEERLRSSAAESAGSTREATQKIKQLRAAMQNHAAGQQLAEAYRLKRMLEEQARLLGQMAEPEAKASAQEMDAAAGAAQAILGELKKSLDQSSKGAGFGSSLREALNQENQKAAEEALSKVQQAQTDAERREQARTAESALSQISNAFAASQPKPLQDARHKDMLNLEAESELQRFAAERSLRPVGKAADAALANIDPARLPQAYRSRIERYFEKLSEE